MSHIHSQVGEYRSNDYFVCFDFGRSCQGFRLEQTRLFLLSLSWNHFHPWSLSSGIWILLFQNCTIDTLFPILCIRAVTLRISILILVSFLLISVSISWASLSVSNEDYSVTFSNGGLPSELTMGSTSSRINQYWLGPPEVFTIQIVFFIIRKNVK